MWGGGGGRKGRGRERKSFRSKRWRGLLPEHVGEDIQPSKLFEIGSGLRADMIQVGLSDHVVKKVRPSISRHNRSHTLHALQTKLILYIYKSECSSRVVKLSLFSQLCLYLYHCYQRSGSCSNNFNLDFID